jgi:LPPG:FO 2-phospho-L-lactate transferase
VTVVALSGGIGGAKLALGLYRELPPEALTVVCNTGDDFEHLGLAISPDLDTVLYTLAGIANPGTGWGRAGETWSFMQALCELGGETWFRLGDRDLAIHVERTRRLAAGQTLSAISLDFCRCFGVRARVLPMSDQPVRTIVRTAHGPLPFQRYFVEQRCAPAVTGFVFEGAAAARPQPAIEAALASPDL